MEKIQQWLFEQSGRLENVIVNAANAYVSKNLNRRNFAFDTARCVQEMRGLSGTQDLCYDRPSIGYCYSIWYHPVRVSSLLGVFEQAMLNSKNEKEINVYDLGAGTGAILWAIGLLYVAMKENGYPTPSVRVINIDSSPFMLKYNEQYLWSEFIKEYAVAKEIQVEYCINNWSNKLDSVQSNHWICASYIFDHNENKKALAEEFTNFIRKSRPSNILLFSSTQGIQIEYIDTVLAGLKGVGYFVNSTAGAKDYYYKGQLDKLVTFRDGQTDFGFFGNPKWDQSKLYSRMLTRQQAELPLTIDSIKIYQGPEVVRSNIKLTDQQISASLPNDQPTIITGPAGCGKSVVLTERIKKIVERVDKPYDPFHRILLTTFNKRLVKVLGDWLEGILDPKQCTRKFYEKVAQWGTVYPQEHSYFKFKGSNAPNIQVLHFDVLPTLLGKVSARKGLFTGPSYSDYHRQLLKETVDDYFSKRPDLNKNDFLKIIDPEFLLEEFNRIFYGRDVTRRDQYMTLVRVGRGTNPMLAYSSTRREIIYDCIYSYMKKMGGLKVETFQMRRISLLKKIRKGIVNPSFTHILVDELQDCTSADHEIFRGLLVDKNQIVLAGDLGQSIQLGGAYHIPTGDEIVKFKKIKLEGSFRLPFRVSESLKELSSKINRRHEPREGFQVELIIPYKYAQPGARPIVVFGADVQQMAEKIAAIYNEYLPYGAQKVSVFEKDTELISAVREKGVKIEADLIVKNKGLEFPMILWSSRILPETKLEQQEYAYTIFTRTSCLLVIAMFDPSEERVKEIIKTFDSDKSIYWDEETANKMAALRGEELHLDDEDKDSSAEVASGTDQASLDEFID